MQDEKTHMAGVKKKDVRKAFVASLSGTSLEWYDYGLYSSAAAVVFPVIFFNAEDPISGTLQAFATYAVGYFARPIGGIIFGRLGDILGRKTVLIWTLMMIGISTLLMGLIPPEASIGVVAPIILVILRLAQGIGVGGEWGAAVMLSSEYGDPEKKGFWASAAQIGVPVGSLLANGVLAVLTFVMSEEDFISYGWRIAFLLSAVLIAFGLWIRVKLEDTPVFQAIASKGAQPDAPIREVLKFELRPLFAAMFSRVGVDAIYTLFVVFSLVYGLQVLGIPREEVLVAVLIGSAVQVPLIPLAGALSDRVGRRLVYGLAAVAGTIFVFLFFSVIQSGSYLSLCIGVAIGLACHAFMYGPQAAFITEQFSPRLRSTGSSLAFSFAGILSATIPFVLTLLLDSFQSWLPVALFVAVAIGVTLIGLSLGRNPNPSEDRNLRAHRPGNNNSDNPSKRKHFENFQIE